jgi:hypothetical protein
VADPTFTSARFPAPWLDESNSSELGRAIVRRAIMDLGLCEIPPGSNRSPRIDGYLKAVGSPVGSPWCAAALSAWWRESGAEVPPKLAGSVDAWRAWGKATGRWSRAPIPGAAAVYGTPEDASHIEVVARVSPQLLLVGGNVGLGSFTREGWVVDLRPLAVDRLLGFIHPTAPVTP